MASLRSTPFWLLLLLALSGSLASCAVEPVEIPDERIGDPYCALITDAYGYFANGDRLLIVDYEVGYVAGGCVCAEEEEVLSGARDDEINAAALEECQRQAATQEFVSNTCEEVYATEGWLDLIYKAEGRYERLAPDGPKRCTGS